MTNFEYPRSPLPATFSSSPPRHDSLLHLPAMAMISLGHRRIFQSAMANSILRLMLLPLLWRISGCYGADTEGLVSREFFPMDGDIAWIVQVSDLHLSAYDHDRARDLEALLAPALRVLRPSLLIVTGDLTDAKNRERTSTTQDEREWVQYRTSMDAVIRKGGLFWRRVIDIRGNHDKYGVPCIGHNLDFFSVHSMSSRLKRLRSIQSISLVGKEWKYVFIGVDDSMAVGLRGPSNIFGHPTDEMLEALDSELCHSDSTPPVLTKKIVFGHFPLSFTISTTLGNRYEKVFSKRSVSAYLCGHLHAKFSNRLWRQHVVKRASDSDQEKERKFWEWELGDWKETRMMRILAIDRGAITFLDMKVNPTLGDDHFLTTILVTYPVDSRSMSQERENWWVVRNDINALVFSLYPVHNVTAKVYDSSRGYMQVEEISLRKSTNSLSSEPLFSAKWNAESYKSPSPDRYFLQVFVIDEDGRETSSEMRPFSVDGRPAPLPTSLANYFFLYVRWETLYTVLFWSNISFLVALLLLPKLLSLFAETRVFSVSLSSSTWAKKSCSWLLHFLLEGSKSSVIWFSLSLYLVYLLSFSWFRGNVASKPRDLGKMSAFGWTMEPSGCPIKREKLGMPDVMTITLPFIYLVVAPLFLLIYGLFAERSAFYFKKSKGKHDSNASKIMSQKRWSRVVILLGCFITGCIHLKFLFILGRAYGIWGIALSPALCWAPPIFLTASIYLSL